MAKEEEEDDEDQHRTCEKGAAQVPDRMLDEARLAEHRLLDPHARREDADDTPERLLDRPRHRRNVHARLLKNEEEDSRLAVDERVTHRHRGPLADLGHGGQGDRHAVAPRKRRDGEVGRGAHSAVEPGG